MGCVGVGTLPLGRPEGVGYGVPQRWIWEGVGGQTEGCGPLWQNDTSKGGRKDRNSPLDRLREFADTGRGVRDGHRKASDGSSVLPGITDNVKKSTFGKSMKNITKWTRSGTRETTPLAYVRGLDTHTCIAAKILYEKH